MSRANIQLRVDNLAKHYGQSVLIEDAAQRPVWWSTIGAVDAIREKTILYRYVDEPTAGVVDDFHIREASSPVQTPAIESLDMWARWCMPIRHGNELLGFLWLLDPDNSISSSDLNPLIDCATDAAKAMYELRAINHQQFSRDELLAKLLRDEDEVAARELISLESLPENTTVQVRIPADPSGWVVGNRFSIHVNRAWDYFATSGQPLPLVQLKESVRRAQLTTQALRAGAKLQSESWNDLGAWRLIVETPQATQPSDIHPGAQELLDATRPELLDTARVLLDNGGDVALSSQQMFLHRTTLYYRIERIAELIGVDIRTDPKRTDLQLALWLASYRNQELL